jgi:hypothetical protein
MLALNSPCFCRHKVWSIQQSRRTTAVLDAFSSSSASPSFGSYDGRILVRMPIHREIQQMDGNKANLTGGGETLLTIIVLLI